MKLKMLLFTIFCLINKNVNAQSSVFKPSYLHYEMDSMTRQNIIFSLDTLFSQISAGKLDGLLIGKDETDFNILKSFSSLEANKKENIPNFYKKQLINAYSISANEYWISISVIGQKDDEAPILRAIINLIASVQNDKITFSTPLQYLTKTWKTKRVGNVTYHFRDKINIKRAKYFDAKNTSIANKLGVKAEVLDFYMCYNYQEILHLLGYEYDSEENGKTRDGYGVDGNKVFSVMNNEDFSHDVFHFYSGKFRQKTPGNNIVEEGVAYSWGNAYYTNISNGEMITQKELVQYLKRYLVENPTANLLDLFNKKPKIFNNLATEISVKSTISSLICDEVERKKGLTGIKTLISCGPGNDNFFKTINELISINQNNFDVEIRKLIQEYQAN